MIGSSGALALIWQPGAGIPAVPPTPPVPPTPAVPTLPATPTLPAVPGKPPRPPGMPRPPAPTMNDPPVPLVPPSPLTTPTVTAAPTQIGEVRAGEQIKEPNPMQLSEEHSPLLLQADPIGDGPGATQVPEAHT